MKHDVRDILGIIGSVETGMNGNGSHPTMKIVKVRPASVTCIEKPGEEFSAH